MVQHQLVHFFFYLGAPECNYVITLDVYKSGDYLQNMSSVYIAISNMKLPLRWFWHIADLFQYIGHAACHYPKEGGSKDLFFLRSKSKSTPIYEGNIGF